MSIDPFTSRADLLLAARQLAVLIAPYSSTVLTTLEDPSTGDLLIPPEFIPMGLHEKKTGGSLSNAQDIADIESHGHGTPTRQIPTKRTIALGFTPQETTRRNLEYYWGGDWDTVTHTAHGGVTMSVPELPLNLHYRVILLGKDDYLGDPVYMYWIGNRVNINKTQDQKIMDADVVTYPYTLNFQAEPSLMSPLLVGLCGSGFAALKDVSDLGFLGS